MEKFETKQEFCTKHNPDMQLKICGDVDKCYFGDFPTLAILNRVYDKGAAAYWLVFELTNLSEFCGCKEKLTGTPLKECAVIIAQQYYYLKTSELMLFFYRFKAGRYGRFYGAVDPLVIMQALREFNKERYAAYDHHESELRQRQYEEDRKKRITYEEYQKKLKAI